MGLLEQRVLGTFQIIQQKRGTQPNDQVSAIEKMQKVDLVWATINCFRDDRSRRAGIPILLQFCTLYDVSLKLCS